MYTEIQRRPGCWPKREGEVIQAKRNEEEQHMQNHEGAHGTFLDLKVIV